MFTFKEKITGKTVAIGTKDVEMTLKDVEVPLKYLSIFWRTVEISLFNCEINLILTWSDKFVLSNSRKRKTFAITNTKLYVPVVTLST